jgi:uncharacterized protein
MMHRCFRIPILLAACFLAASVYAPQGPGGYWVGQWVRDGSVLAVEMTFSRTASGYTGSFSSSQLRVVGIPLTGIVYKPPAITWKVVGDQDTSVFTGTVRGDTLAGSYTEGQGQGTFMLKRAKPPEAAVRETDVTFSNGAVTLGGTVVSPEGGGPFPGIVFMQGSGAEGRWANHYLADAFAHRGVVALIYDKRGVGGSTGDWTTAGFADLVGDAAAGVEKLRSLPQVAPDRVGIFGHSQGGTIAPWVAVSDPHVAFVVAGAPAGVSMADLETYSLSNTLDIAHLPAAQQPLARKFVHAIVATAYEGAPRSQLDNVAQEVKDYPWAFEPPPPSYYYWSFSHRNASYDPLAYWRRVAVPALILFGEDDQRVPPRRSAANIGRAYLGAKGPSLDVIFFPNADHSYYLQQNANGRFTWPVSAPGYPDRMIDWVLAVTGTTQAPAERHSGEPTPRRGRARGRTRPSRLRTWHVAGWGSGDRGRSSIGEGRPYTAARRVGNALQRGCGPAGLSQARRSHE